MTENEQIGAKMKARRLQKGLTLKQLGDLTDLSVGFLSQAERGLTTISLNSLYRLANPSVTAPRAFVNSARRLFPAVERLHMVKPDPDRKDLYNVRRFILPFVLVV